MKYDMPRMLEDLSLDNCLFRCNHASNYLPLKGKLPGDRNRLTALLGDVVKNPGKYRLKQEHMRGL